MPLNINEKMMLGKKKLQMPHICLSQTVGTLLNESILVLRRILPLLLIHANAEL